MRVVDENVFYRRAVARLSEEERERERSRAIPYAYSLSALSAFFLQTGRRQGWLVSDGTGPERPIVLGVSGGSDSMAMLWLFRTFCDGPLVVAHLDHGMRGETALEDARYVERMAQGWGIESVVLHSDVPGGLRRGESLESGGRRIRHAFLISEAEKRKAFGVALAHNREDVAETVLFNLLRGTGVRGAVGIPERRGVFFRPVLDCSRGFLREILRHRGIEWREDCTNADERFTRNFIRNELMPLIERRINPKAAEHLVAFAEDMRYYREDEENQARHLFESTVFENGEGGCIERERLQNLSVREKTVLIRALGRRRGLPALSRERSMELARLLTGRARFVFQWGAGATVEGDRERACWRGGNHPVLPEETR